MSIKVCLGLGFGDCGKGRVVDYLCRKATGIPRVVRFNGGHQAAHQVVHPDAAHVFAHFGSGTFQGAPTYWSQYCPVSPPALLYEREVIMPKIVKKEVPYPRLVIDRRAPVTTPWDRAWNQVVEKGAQHGSCGVGIRSTWEREEMGYHLWAEDLDHPEVLSRKLHILSETCPHYAGVRSKDLRAEIERFLQACLVLFRTPGIELGESVNIFEAFPNIPHPGNEMIYEGAQGLMLDSQFGFFPHVTPSRTGTHNLLALRRFEIEPWLVTRAYATRHGNGPFVPFEGELSLKENPWESNFDGGLQGKFRTGPLSLDYLRYAVSKDHYLACHLDSATLVITCTDLLDRDYVVSDKGRIVRYQDAHDMYAAIARAVGVKRVLLSSSAVSDEDLVEFVDNR